MSTFYAGIGYDPPKQDNHVERFQWLAAYQTREMSLGDVMLRFEPAITQSAVLKSLQKCAKQIGLPLRGSLNRVSRQKSTGILD